MGTDTPSSAAAAADVHEEPARASDVAPNGACARGETGDAEGGVAAPVSDPPAPGPIPTSPSPSDGSAGWRRVLRAVKQWFRDYFMGDDPSFGLAIVPYCFLSMLLFTRHPTKTNFIFDEQEALLANPFVRSVADAQPKFGWLDAFRRDFWGLGPERSIGSYRPIPDLVWRALWAVGAREQTPFLHHWVNVLMHGVNGALVCVLAFQLTRSRMTAWLAGASFTMCALLTEAVSGVVGIADVLGATGVLAALCALAWKMPWMGLGVFFGTLFGLYSKESALCAVPLLPLTALLTAQNTHPAKPRRWARALVAAVAAAAAFVLYVEARRRLFPAAIPAELSQEANADKPWGPRTFAAILRWYAQPSLPKDPLNNPLVGASPPYRIAGALRVYFRGLEQILFPHPLSGDYSAPQEPVPDHLFSVESVLGGLCFVLPFPLAAWFGVRAWQRWRSERSAAVRDASAVTDEPITPATNFATGPVVPLRVDLRPVIGAALVWIVVSYFPVSNIPILLPTVRAERFWYFPVIGSSILLGIAGNALLEYFDRGGGRRTVVSLIVAFFAMQSIFARLHANDYTDDLTFWDATRKAVPRSAKAHLNYSVMKGARGDLQTRLTSNATALELAPTWAMASVYLGDTLCRLHRTDEAWPHYARGFELAPNDVNLVALGLQCLWDEKALEPNAHLRDELALARDKHPGSWVEYLARDLLEHGEEHNGVDPKYRPRGYNEGPKDP